MHTCKQHFKKPRWQLCKGLHSNDHPKFGVKRHFSFKIFIFFLAKNYLEKVLHKPLPTSVGASINLTRGSSSERTFRNPNYLHSYISFSFPTTSSCRVHSIHNKNYYTQVISDIISHQHDPPLPSYKCHCLLVHYHPPWAHFSWLLTCRGGENISHCIQISKFYAQSGSSRLTTRSGQPTCKQSRVHHSH